MATWSFPPKIYFRVLWVIICEGMTILLCICLQHVGWYSSLVGLNISCQLLVFTTLCAKGGGEFCETLSLQVFLSRFSRALRGPLQSGAQSSLAPRSWRDVLDLLWNGSTWSVLQVHVATWQRGNVPQRKAASNYMAGADNLEREAGRHICCLHVSLGHHEYKNVLNFFCMDEWRSVIIRSVFVLKLRAERWTRCATGETSRFVKELFCSLSLEAWGTQCTCIAIFQWT